MCNKTTGQWKKKNGFVPQNLMTEFVKVPVRNPVVPMTWQMQQQRHRRLQRTCRHDRTVTRRRRRKLRQHETLVLTMPKRWTCATWCACPRSVSLAPNGWCVSVWVVPQEAWNITPAWAAVRTLVDDASLASLRFEQFSRNFSKTPFHHHPTRHPVQRTTAIIGMSTFRYKSYPLN